jgi:hypothetical protein
MQTKETLTLRQSSFGSKVDLPPKFMTKVAECGVLEGVLSFASHKQDKAMKKSDGAKRQRITGKVDFRHLSHACPVLPLSRTTHVSLPFRSEGLKEVHKDISRNITRCWLMPTPSIQ